VHAMGIALAVQFSDRPVQRASGLWREEQLTIVNGERWFSRMAAIRRNRGGWMRDPCGRSRVVGADEANAIADAGNGAQIGQQMLLENRTCASTGQRSRLMPAKLKSCAGDEELPKLLRGPH